jgi:hypothetical protein
MSLQYSLCKTKGDKMSISVNLQVPPSVYRLAKKTAEATSRPVEQVLVDVLSAASPDKNAAPEMRPPTANKLRRLIAAQADYRCGYCLTSERLTGIPLNRQMKNSSGQP